MWCGEEGTASVLPNGEWATATNKRQSTQTMSRGLLGTFLIPYVSSWKLAGQAPSYP